MASTARLQLRSLTAPGAPAQAVWDEIVAAVSGWCRRAFADSADERLRDAVLLLPFAEHLPLARAAWARQGGWMPRIETTQTLAASLGPPVGAAAGQVSFDTANDRLSARRLLASQRWAVDWSRRDPRGYAHALALLVDAAQALARSAAAVAPGRREAHWDEARALLGPINGPGAVERQLARVALEWVAAAGAVWSTDRLHALRPSAWLAVQAGGADPLVERLLAEADPALPCAVFDTDADLAEPFAAVAARLPTRFEPRIDIAVCDGFEAEAQAAAAQLLAHLARGERPVALVAQDRSLIRRVRALLERQRVPLDDETGWRLSTSRAGAQVMSLLRAAEPGAGTDEWIEWLKNSSRGNRPGLASLEARLRRERWTRPAAVDAARLDPAAAALWRQAAETIAAFVAPPRKTFGAWLRSLDEALQAGGARPALDADDAGAQVLAALGLDGGRPAAPAWSANHDGLTMSVDDFRDWVGTVLESVAYLPPAPAGTAGQGAAVVVTPLARVMLRPFAAAVLPGCDEKRLGRGGEAPALLGEALADALGVPGPAALRGRETLAFAQLLRLPQVTLLRRRADGAEPLAASPLVERLLLAAAGNGAVGAWNDSRTGVPIEPRPVPRPLPVAPGLLPQQLSAGACEALRACPYRFFALHMLGLGEAEEFDDAVGKGDYGQWLHAVLHAFHRHRDRPAAAGQEVERLIRLGHDEQQCRGLRDDDFLPYRLSFEQMAPRYVDWLHGREAAGAHWLDGEREVAARSAALAGVELVGRLDRLDRIAPRTAGAAPSWQLIDYKTTSEQRLRSRLRQPLEDTQLAFYAALLAADAAHEAGAADGGDTAVAGPAIGAMYLALDGKDGIRTVEHADVSASAAVLVAGIARDYERLRAGAALPALGEGAVCEHCAARGLCRRDHWPAAGA